MGLTKYATLEQAQVLDVKGTEQRAKTASLDKLADFHDFRTEDGYLYARIRAISSRVNKNHDGWPSVELAGGQEIWDSLNAQRESSTGGFTVEASDDHEYGYSTFMHKPIFVDHHNSDPEKARGVIVDSKFNVLDHKTAAEHDDYWSENPAPEHMPPVEVELLLEVDAKSFPKLAKAIVSGDIDGFSMGCDVEKSVCSICKQAATSPDEYCAHVKQKGGTFNVTSDTGERTSRTAYEDCYGIKFFEISAVFDPADETALAREIVSSVHKEADHDPPQGEHSKAPEEVNTLRTERVCPVCGSDIEDVKCDVCGYVPEPDGLDNPDLDRAKERREEDGEAKSLGESLFGDQAEPITDPQPDPTGDAKGPFQSATKGRAASSVTSEMAWSPEITPRLAAVLADTPSTAEPQENVEKDEDRPTTARTQGDDMSADARVAATPADTSAKPDKQVDVTGVGGVDHATNEEASQPRGPHGEGGTTTDVEGKGGVYQDSNQETSKPDETESVSNTADDNSGFDKSKTTDDSGPTKTFDNSNQPGTAVTDKAFPTSAKQGPAKPPKTKGLDVDADARVDVENDEHFENAGTDTDQWTGTGGNGVTRQADPVTPKVGPGNDVTSNRTFAAFKLADQEVEVGLIDREQKYDRAAELLELSEDAFEGVKATVSRVRTAGLQKKAAEQTKRVPSLQRQATQEPKTASEETPIPDEALFS